MQRIIAALALAAGISALAPAPDAAAQSPNVCRRTGYRLDSSVRAAESVMTVTQNARCSSALQQTNLRDPRVERRPTSGRVELDGNNYIYVPNPGFTGGDRFVVSWANAPDGARVNLTVNVRVDPPGASPPAPVSAARAPRAPAQLCRYLANGALTDQMQYGNGSMIVARNRACRVSLNGIVVTGVASEPSNGHVQVNGGTYEYVPNPNFTGTDRFSVTYNVQGHNITNVVNVQVVP
jgi:hypothetical protein